MGLSSSSSGRRAWPTCSWPVRPTAAQEVSPDGFRLSTGREVRPICPSRGRIAPRARLPFARPDEPAHIGESLSKQLKGGGPVSHCLQPRSQTTWSLKTRFAPDSALRLRDKVAVLTGYTSKTNRGHDDGRAVPRWGGPFRIRPGLEGLLERIAGVGLFSELFARHSFCAKPRIQTRKTRARDEPHNAAGRSAPWACEFAPLRRYVRRHRIDAHHVIGRRAFGSDPGADADDRPGRQDDGVHGGRRRRRDPRQQRLRTPRPPHRLSIASGAGRCRSCLDRAFAHRLGACLRRLRAGDGACPPMGVVQSAVGILGVGARGPGLGNSSLRDDLLGAAVRHACRLRLGRRCGHAWISGSV